MTIERDEPIGGDRRSFLKSALLASGGAMAGAGSGLISGAQAQTPLAGDAGQGKKNHYFVPASDKTVHWGYFSKSLTPVVEIDSGDFVTIEALTHHAYDDYERMIKGDPGAESVYLWTKDKKNVNRRGAGPMDASIHGRGAGEGFGVHICTGPVAVRGAAPGDILEVRIIDCKAARLFNPDFEGKAFGSNAAAWWGFQYNDLLTEPKPREVITIYELDASGEKNWAKAVYNFRWMPADRPVRRRSQDYRLSGRPGRPQPGQGEPRRPEKYPHPDPAAFRRHSAGAKGSRHRQFDPARLFRRQYRQLADRQGRDDVLPGSGARAGSFRSAIRTPRRAIPNSAARRSNAR